MKLKLPLSIFFSKRILLVIFLFNSTLTLVYSQCIINGTSTTWTSPPSCSYRDGITVTNGGQLTIDCNLYNLTGGIFVNDGGQLIINNYTIGIAGSGVGIIVSRGGKLYLNSSNIIFNGGVASSNPANVGIECIGAFTTAYDNNGNLIQIPLDEQFDVFPDPNVLNNNAQWEGTLNPNQSQVIVKNSTIKYAEYGIRSTLGGIIRVSEGSVFDDCQTAIDIGPWHSASYPQTNACYFMNSTFKWSTYNTPVINYHLMKFNNVNGINIGGCTFTTNYSLSRCYRGTGIFSYLSTYVVTQGGNSFCEGTSSQISLPISPKCLTNCMLSGPTIGCTFSNLDSAISFIGDQNNSDNGALNVRFSTFQNNLIGIVAKYGRDFRIDNNIFKGNALVMNDPLLSGINSIFNYCTTNPKIDILLYESSAFKIYKNEFEFDGNADPATQTPVNHIIIDGSHTFNSLIMSNNFKSFINSNIDVSNVTGITIDGLNPGLLIICNTFIDMGIDILVKPSSSIQIEQENPTDFNARNSFSSLLTDRERLKNIGSVLIEYRYDGFGGSSYDPLTVGVNPLAPAAGGETVTCTIDDCEGYLVKTENIYYKKGVITLYPNPASNKIFISTNNIEMKLVKKVEIYNVEGKLLLTKYFDGSETEYMLELNDFKSGLYILKMEDSNNISYSQKFIVE